MILLSMILPISLDTRQRPSGHLRCASSAPPGVSVVGAHFCGEAAFASSRDGASRLRLGTTRRSSLQLGAERVIGAPAPLDLLEGDALPCSRPARYALRAIYDVLPQHRPVFRLSAPTFAAKLPLHPTETPRGRLNPIKPLQIRHF